ncbi:hypothetical protein BT0002_04750 [Helicobacter pylori]
MAEQDPKELIFSGITIYTDKNSTRAKKYFKKSLRIARGCYALAAFYNEAKSVAKDEKQMTENLKKACELGLKEACGILKEQK